MWLPARKIQAEFDHQDGSSKDELVIAVACQSCKHAETYFINKKSENHNPKDGVILAEFPSYGDVYLIAVLGCEMGSCNARMPLFAHWRVDMAEADKRADMSRWKATELICPNGHPVSLPINEVS
jgi:hypothetical protein